MIFYEAKNRNQVSNMFHKRDNVQRRLVKIKKQESKTLKFLLKQEEELSKVKD